MITGSLHFVCHLVFGTEHSILETGFIPILRWKSEEAPTQLGLLERASLSHLTSHAELVALHHCTLQPQKKIKPNDCLLQICKYFIMRQLAALLVPTLKHQFGYLIKYTGKYDIIE
jgi:hypothetical protein